MDGMSEAQHDFHIDTYQTGSVNDFETRLIRRNVVRRHDGSGILTH